MILPAFILLLITIIDIPMALLILPLFVLVAMILGYTSVSLIAGEKLKQSTNLKPQTQMLILALGILEGECSLILLRIATKIKETGANHQTRLKILIDLSGLNIFESNARDNRYRLPF